MRFDDGLSSTSAPSRDCHKSNSSRSSLSRAMSEYFDSSSRVHDGLTDSANAVDDRVSPRSSAKRCRLDVAEIFEALAAPLDH